MDELIQLINLGRETRNIDFKATYDWGNPVHKGKITKTILGMANISDGGHIILGVKETEEGSFIPEGMPDDHYMGLDTDTILSHVNNFADPYVDIELHKFDYEGRKFAIIRVSEFDEIPVICKKNGEGLRMGVIYTRSRRMPETVAVPSQTEMREILDLGTQKMMRRIQRTITGAGLVVQSQITDEQLFNKELGGL